MGVMGESALKAQLRDVLRVQCCLKRLIHNTQEALRLGEEKLTKSIFCMGKIYKEVLLFGQFYVYSDS